MECPFSIANRNKTAGRPAAPEPDSVEKLEGRSGWTRALRWGVCGEWRRWGGGSQLAPAGVGWGASLASFLRFWAVAARRNSSRAPSAGLTPMTTLYLPPALASVHDRPRTARRRPGFHSLSQIGPVDGARPVERPPVSMLALDAESLAFSVGDVRVT